MNRSFPRFLRDRVCEHEAAVRMLFGFSVVVFLLMLVSLTVVESGTATYVITIINLVSLIVVGGVSGTVLVACRKGRNEE